ncbi:MAG TPA: ketopantoate reductase family protein [Candidatus Acidoferrales bacterium]|jgi:2-dehydropantoate 2-reductase|nr:ketopantoate reductase family protein [Candidatus Acidoferrales bacterium]
MRILVVGAGAVGGYFGGRLAQAGRDVTFLVRDPRAREINAKGLQIVSPYGDVALHPRTVNAAQIAAPYDLVLLSVKSYSLSSAMRDFAAAVGPETMIYPVLNGMRHVDLLVERFGKHAVLGGVSLVATEIDGDGRIRQLTNFQKLIYGELDGRVTPRLEKLDETLRGAGFDAAISTDILRDMWQKWVMLATLGALTCLLRGNIGEIASVPGGADLSCMALAAANGYPQSSAFLEDQTAKLTAKDSKLTSSMYRDLTKGAPVEVDTIVGDLLERGRKHGLATPLLQAAYVNLSIYQRSVDRVKSAAK